MARTLYLIRHGRTEGDDVRRYKGSLDVPLSKDGIEGMTKAAEALKGMLRQRGEELKAVYTSGLRRARKSAEIIAGEAGLTPIVVPDLRERHFGQWEGMSFDEINALYPDAFSAWASDPLRFSPPGGETTLEVSQRVGRAIGEILGRHTEDTIAIVAHGGVNRAILCELTGVPLENIFRIEQDHGAISIVEFHEGFPVLKLLNWAGWMK